MAVCLRLLGLALLFASPAAACWRCRAAASTAPQPAVLLVVVPVAPGDVPVYIPPYVPPAPPAPAPPAPAPPAPAPPAPAPPASRQAWAYYLVDAAHATPGQLELARSVPVRQAVKAAGLGFRLLRSDQAQVAELGLLPLIEREGVPLFVMVDERGTVLRLLRAPMESDVLALLEGVAP